MQPADSPAAWHPDPTGRYEYRYFNGERWTSDVSVGGQRFVDVVTPGTAAAATPAFVRRPAGRGLALASFWVGLASLLSGWVPFVFVIAAAGAITAFVFAVVALRRTGRATAEVAAGVGAPNNARSFATAGLVLSVLALGACVLGFWLTHLVLRELNEFVEAGPHRAEIDQCTAVDRLVTLTGTITNLDDRTHTYTVTVSYHMGGTEIGRDVTQIDDVPAGESGTFESTEFAEMAPITTDGSSVFVPVECRIVSVSGPLPFGEV